MNASRLSNILRNAVPFSLQKVLPFSSFSPAAKSRFSNFFSDDPDGGSPVYRHALRFQRPSTVRSLKHLYNSVSFIGSVALPVKKCAGETSGVYTLLDVTSSRESDRTVRILVKMWDELAEISLKHLRPYDIIYVSGHLNSYKKVDGSGKFGTFYEVIVKELNYVTQGGRYQTCKKSEKSEPKEERTPVFSASDMEDRRRDRLHLWQVFFANPDEWWDNRHRNVNPKSPDFKHKDTGEVLWLSETDPPWVTRQLRQHDSRMTERGYREPVGTRSRVSMWKYKD